MPRAEIFSSVSFTRYETNRAIHDRHAFAALNLVHEAALKQEIALNSLTGEEPWLTKIVDEYKLQNAEANFTMGELKRRLIEASAP